MIKSSQAGEPAEESAATQQTVAFPGDVADRPATGEKPRDLMGGDKAGDKGAGKGAEKPPEFHRWKTGWVIAVGAILLLVLGIALTIGIILRVKKEHALANETAEDANAPPRVQIVTARIADAQTARTLPGNAQAFLEAAIYGRTNGYLKSRLVDIGDKVVAGQLLGEIATPEVDAQLAQAKATLAQSKATLESNKAAEVFATADELRYRTLRRPGAATEQDYENRLMTMRMDTATVHATEATIQSNEANIQRLTALVGFEQLRAPFSGVITLRNVDPGDLITADNPSTERQLFRVAQIDPLRVFVQVPQVYSTAVKPGQDAILFRREEPQRLYKGKVTRTANALNPTTRTLRTEVDVPNPKGELLPGMFLEVKFIMSRTVAPVIVPSDAIITRTGGSRVAVMDGAETVRYRQVELGRDFGATLEVLSGLKGGEKVIVHPGDDLVEGTKVQPVTAKKSRSGNSGGEKQGTAQNSPADGAQKGGEQHNDEGGGAQDGADRGGQDGAGSSTGSNAGKKGQGDAPSDDKGAPETH